MALFREQVDDTGENPEMENFNALGTPDEEFTVIKDVNSPICFLDLKLDGEWVPMEEIGIRRLVTEVEINDCTDCKKKEGQLNFYDPDGSLIESELLSEGLELRIGMGFLGDVRNFGSWVVNEVNPIIGPTDFRLEMKLQCLSCFMDRTADLARYENITAGEIAKLVAAKYGLEPSVADPGDVIPEFSQAYESDWSVMDKLAQSYGYHWYVEDDQLIFRPPESKTANFELNFWPKPVEGQNPRSFRFGNLASARYSCKKDSECGKSS